MSRTCQWLGRRRLRWWALAAVLVAGLVYLASAYADPDPGQLGAPAARATGHHHRGRAPAPALVTVAPHAGLTPVPRSFLGISTEYWALPLWSGQMPLLERVLALVRVPEDGPLSLRIGGDSADHSFWDPHALAAPPWAFEIHPRWLGQARRLVASLGARLTLDLNLITDSPAAATRWAQAAEAALPRGSIAAFEVGNEPDIYSRVDWLAITGDRRSLDGRLPAVITAGDYVRDFRRYARALAQVAPQVAVDGPALARPQVHARWVGTLIAGARDQLGMVTVHRYPLSACAHRTWPSFPTVARLLSPAAAEGMAAALRPVIRAAHDAGLPLRLTELNSVNCGGRPGVSDTFATALWAPDALFSLLRAGVDGADIHVRADTINAPFALGADGLDARPLLYGLILFAHALGPDSRLVNVHVRARPALNFRAYAVRTGPDTLRVVLIDKGARSARVSLRLPTTGAPFVQRLLAPSAGARTGVTLGGQWLGEDGRWHGAARLQRLTPRGGVYVVVVRHASAALLSVPVRAGDLGSAATGARRPREAGRAPPVAASRLS